MKKNTCDQPTAWVNQPMIGAKITVAKYCAELKMETAKTRFASREPGRATRLLLEKTVIHNKPTIKRKINNAMMALAMLNISTKPL